MDYTESHPRTIIHIDIDCFYAQVEEIRNPLLRTQPLGIQQKNIIVTSNYVARKYGVNKLMLLSDAKKICPELVLVNGEDLTNYRQMSTQIFNVLQTFTPVIEKLGFDENFLDVTSIINQKLVNDTGDYGDSYDNDYYNKFKPIGYVHPEDETFSSCKCDCGKRLILGTQLAQQIRDQLYNELNITCCAGIAHNKLLAKLIGNINKPNKQTVLIPMCAPTVLASINALRSINGIGEKTEKLLNEINIKNIRDLQDIDINILQKKFGAETAYRLKDMSYGIDDVPVKTSGKPKSISLEDSCKSLSLLADVEEKFRLLLTRLIKHVIEDGRIPITIKIILRKYNTIKKTSHRETKQANIIPSLFQHIPNGKLKSITGAEDKLLKIIMRLFERSVDLNKPFNITLIGLAFSKFNESNAVIGSRSIANYLIKKSDIEVQSITNLSNDSIISSPSVNSNNNSMQMDLDSISDTSFASYSSDVSESEIEPSPKKSRVNLLLANTNIPIIDSFDVSSPSKLRVADLRLNSKDLDNDHHSSSSIQYKQSIITSISSLKPFSSESPPLIKSLSFATTATTTPPTPMTVPTKPTVSQSKIMASATITSTSSHSHLQPTVDPTIFKELPFSIQKELFQQWNTTTSSLRKNENKTLHRYFIDSK